MSEKSIESIWARPATAAKLIDCSVARVYQLMDCGRIKAIKLEGMRLVSVASIKALENDPEGTEVKSHLSRPRQKSLAKFPSVKRGRGRPRKLPDADALGGIDLDDAIDTLGQLGH